VPFGIEVGDLSAMLEKESPRAGLLDTTGFGSRRCKRKACRPDNILHIERIMKVEV
jgi:hypothetical protein